MKPARTLATARRVLRQLGHDHRTIGLLLFVPVLLLVLLYYVFDADRRAFDSIGPEGIKVRGNALLDAILGTALGLFVSAFAASEFQVVQFMPAIIFPQILLCGLFAPRDSMQTVLEYVSNALPMSYAVDGMNEVLQHSDPTGDFVRDAIVDAGSALLVLCVGAATLRRRTP